MNARLYERLLRDVEWMEEAEKRPVYRHVKRAFDVLFSASTRTPHLKRVKRRRS